jgi:hypothetical protein
MHAKTSGGKGTITRLPEWPTISMWIENWAMMPFCGAGSRMPGQAKNPMNPNRTVRVFYQGLFATLLRIVKKAERNEKARG